MIIALSIFLILLGFVFISLGLLFINYELSPLKKIVDKEYINQNSKLGFQIALPGIVLMILAYRIAVSN